MLKIQKLNKKDQNVGLRYFKVLSAVNDFQLTERELELLTYTVTQGSLNKEEFCELYKASLSNLSKPLKRLLKLKLLIEEDDKILPNPIVNLPFNEGVILEIWINR